MKCTKIFQRRDGYSQYSMIPCSFFVTVSAIHGPKNIFLTPLKSRRNHLSVLLSTNERRSRQILLMFNLVSKMNNLRIREEIVNLIRNIKRSAEGNPTTHNGPVDGAHFSAIPGLCPLREVQRRKSCAQGTAGGDLCARVCEKSGRSG